MTFASSSKISIPNKKAIIIVLIIVVLIILWLVLKPKAATPVQLAAKAANPYNLSPSNLTTFDSLGTAQAKADFVKTTQPTTTATSPEIANNLTKLGDTTSTTPAAQAANVTQASSSSGFTLNPSALAPLQGYGYASAYVQVAPIDANGCDAYGNDANGVLCGTIYTQVAPVDANGCDANDNDANGFPCASIGA